MKTYTLEKLTALLDKHGIKYFDAKDDDYICVKFVESEMTPLTEVQVDAIQGHLQYMLERLRQERIPHCATHLNDDPVVDRIAKDIYITILEDLTFTDTIWHEVLKHLELEEILTEKEYE